MKELIGTIKNIRTKTKTDAEGDTTHVTTINLEIEDLDRNSLDNLSWAEFVGRQCALDMAAPADKLTTT